VQRGATVQHLMVQSNLLCSKMFQGFKMRNVMNLAASKKRANKSHIKLCSRREAGIGM
jgi:hypothetical protein